MHTITYTDLRQHLSSALDRVNQDHTPMLVTRQKGKEAVLISYDDYKSLEETLHLLSSPANSKRLLKSIEELETGKGKERDIIE